MIGNRSVEMSPAAIVKVMMEEVVEVVPAVVMEVVVLAASPTSTNISYIKNKKLQKGIPKNKRQKVPLSTRHTFYKFHFMRFPRRPGRITGQK